MSETYWAALPRDEFAPKAMERIRAHRKWMARTGQGEKILKLWRAYHGLDGSGGDSAFLSRTGRDGNLVKVTVNGVRPVVQALLSMAMANRPSMLPVASNSDAAAREAADVSKGVLEHFHRVHRRPETDKKAAETGLSMSAGYTVIEWDAGAGEPVAADPENPNAPGLMSGDFEYDNATPFDVFWDPRERNWRRKMWVAVRRYKSKWELAARFPEKAAAIIALRGEEKTGEDAEYVDIRWASGVFEDDGDLIPVYTFWHLDCAALPGGRQVLFCADDVVLTDGPLPYDRLPVFRVAPGEVLGTSHGYTNAFDALGVGDVANALYSAATTNNTKFGVPVLMAPKGSGLNYQQMGVGGAFLEYNPGAQGAKPEAMNFTKTAPELYDFIDRLSELQRQAMGMNSTAMGNPAFAGMAASLAALMDAKAQAFNDGLQQDLHAYYEDTATHELQVLKRFAHDERVAVIAGKSKNWMLKKFTGESLGPVERIAVEPVNSAARTTSGKWALVEMLPNLGIQLKPKDVLNFLATGELDSSFEAEQANTLRLKAENEALMEGQPHLPTIADTHWLDIPEHMALLSNPSVRQDPALVDAVLTAVSEHMRLWSEMPPELLQAMGGPPPPMPAPAMGPDGMPLPPDAGGMPPPSAPPMGPDGGAPPPNPFTPPGGPDEMPGLPPLPPGAAPPPNGVA